MENFANYPSLRGRHVVVTGGATGIGRSLVEHFHAQGSAVSFLDIAQQQGEALANELGSRAHFYFCDLRNIESLKELIAEAIERFGPVRALINNAAKDDRHSIEDVDSESVWVNLVEEEQKADEFWAEFEQWKSDKQ